MTCTILKGIDVANSMKSELCERAAKYTALTGHKPKLAVVRVGSKPDDIAYERGAFKRCEGIGIGCDSHVFQADITNDGFFEAFNKLNSDDGAHGILVLSPLPKHIDISRLRDVIDPKKDVDCLGRVNMAKLFEGDLSGHAPCTPSAVIETLRHFDISLVGRRVTLIGRSPVVGKPLSALLIAAHATVTVCHTRTVDLATECRRADILIAAAGKANMVDSSFVCEGAVVIDVGINVDDGGKLCGDVSFESVSHVAGKITPVPGGIGSVTTSILARNTLSAAYKILGRV